MKFCSKCGIKLSGKEKFCPGCGAEAWIYSTEAEKIDKSNNVDEVIEKLEHTQDTTFEYDFNDIISTKHICIFSYLGVLFLIPLVLCKESKFVKFHANQGLILFIYSMILTAITRAISYLPFISFVSGILSLVVSVSILLFMVLGIKNTVNGKAKELPIIGKYRLIK